MSRLTGHSRAGPSLQAKDSLRIYRWSNNRLRLGATQGEPIRLLYFTGDPTRGSLER